MQFTCFFISFFSFIFFLRCYSSSGSSYAQILIFRFIGASLKLLVGQSHFFCPLPESTATLNQAESLCWHLQKEFLREFRGVFFYKLILPFSFRPTICAFIVPTPTYEYVDAVFSFFKLPSEFCSSQMFRHTAVHLQWFCMKDHGCCVQKKGFRQNVL